jgi:hypothetical protein
MNYYPILSGNIHLQKKRFFTESVPTGRTFLVMYKGAKLKKAQCISYEIKNGKRLVIQFSTRPI